MQSLCEGHNSQLIPKDMQEPHRWMTKSLPKVTMVLGSLVRPCDEAKGRGESAQCWRRTPSPSQNHWIRGAEGSTPVRVPDFKKMQRDAWAATHLWRDTLHISILQLSTRAGVGEGQVRAAEGSNEAANTRALTVLLHSKGMSRSQTSKREISTERLTGGAGFSGLP